MEEVEMVEQESQKRIRVLIADDHPLICIALRKILDDQADIEIVGEVTNGEDAVKLTKRLLPDLVIMDITMPKLNGLEATSQIKLQCPNTLVLILSVHTDDQHIFGIFNAGADGYLTKAAMSGDIVNAIKSLVAGDAVLTADIFRHILKNALRYPVKSSSNELFDNITAREREILFLTVQGMSNKEIASHLNITIATVKNYFVEIFSKLNVKSRTEAAISALRAGIIRLDDTS